MRVPKRPRNKGKCSSLACPTTPIHSSLSETEERIWCDFIQDGSSGGPFSARPDFAGMCLKWRICCDYWMKSGRHVCHGCGMRESHRLGGTNTGYPTSNLDSQATIKPEHLNGQDYFGNTPLHFAAALPHWQTEYIINVVNNGADTGSVNTSARPFFMYSSNTLVPLVGFEILFSLYTG